MSACFPESGAVGWAASSPSLRLTSVGASAEVELIGLNVGAFVEMFGGSEGPGLWSWAITDLDAEAAFGITVAATEQIIGSDLVNLFYCWDGRLIQNGAVMRTGPRLKSGDSLVLYFDPGSEKAAFILNGVAV